MSPTTDGHGTRAREYDVFYRRGSFARSKYRVRRHGRTDVVFLERKLARPGLVTKRRTEIPLDAFARAGQPGPAADGTAADASRAPGRRFHRRLEARRLKPVCRVSYLQTARVGMTDRGLKYSGEMPHEFLGLVGQFGLAPRPASKYRLSVVAPGYAPPGALRSAVETA